MALPKDYSNAHHYFTEAIEFLNSYSWIYQHSNTKFLKAEVLEKFSSEFKNYFLEINNEDLNEFPLLKENNENLRKKENLYRFRKKLKTLIPSSAFTEVLISEQNKNKKQILRKMNLKKQHEIQILAETINNSCQDCDLLIDFGAGLGYLSEMLYSLSQNKFLILGLEAERARVEAAEKRQSEFMPLGKDRIIYKEQFIRETSLDFITNSSKTLAQKNSIESPRMAIVGLHACADLTITAMKLFFEMGSNLRRLIIMPCCYHKLEMISENEFRNFPLSETLKNVLKKTNHNFGEYLNRPFLRLACQQTLKRWLNTSEEEHNNHGLQMFRRGIVEAIVNDEIEYVEKKKGGVSKNKGKREDNQTFAFLCEEYELKSKITEKILTWNHEHERRFNILCEKYPEGNKLAEGLTCLQTAMQKLCENIVLYDRLCYMEEHASSLALKLNVRYEKLLDEKLSPRCYALIAEKL